MKEFAKNQNQIAEPVQNWGTFEDAEHNNLLTGIRMSTRGKIELFEEMLNFAWKTGAIKRPNEAAASKSKLPESARTPSKR